MESTEGFWNGLGFGLAVLCLCFGIGQCTRSQNEEPETQKERVCKHYSNNMEEYNNCYGTTRR